MAVKTKTRPGTTEIRPFSVDIPQADLDDLKRRIAATRWPDKETVDDQSQGVPLATIQAVARYWEKEYDWRKVESRLNALPQFMTTIDGVDIHFIHVRSKHEDALPLIVTHGWPGSVIEQMKIIEPLTDPTAHGGSPSDAFHLVIPSLPGHGFSGKPTSTGWNPQKIASAWTELMTRLGYSRFVAQGGDWGAVIVDQMGLQAPPELLGIHTNMPGAIPPEIDLLFQGDTTGANNAMGSLPSGLSDDEMRAAEEANYVWKHVAYALMMATRPQTLTGLADSPVGLASFLLDHDAKSLALIAQVFDGAQAGLTRDDILDNISLYWLTNTAISASRLYAENKLVLRRQGRHRAGGGECLPRRAVRGPAELGGAGVPEPHVLQQAGRRRALRGLGTAQDLLRRASHRLPVAALDGRAPAPAERGGRVAQLRAARPRRPAGSRRTPRLRPPREPDQWALSGEWTIGSENIAVGRAGGSIAFRFHARDAHLVLAPGTGRSIPFRVLLDGEAPGPWMTAASTSSSARPARSGSGPWRSRSASPAPRRTPSRSAEVQIDCAHRVGDR